MHYRPDSPQLGQPLSPSQLRVAHEVAHGGVNREIASRLFLAPSTIRRHLHDIFVKLGVTTRIGMLDRLGWIDDSREPRA